MQTQALVLLFTFALAAKPAQPAHDWLSPSRSMVTVVAVERKCPGPDFELVDNDTCVKTVEIPAEASCSRANAVLQDDNTTCVTTEFFPPERVCPPNAVFNGEQCDIFNVQSPEPQCETGDEYINGECVKYDTKAGNMLCPKGYQLKGDRCVHVVVTTPDLLCPPDYKKAHDNTCIHSDIKTVIPDCPEGSVFHNGICLSEPGIAIANSRGVAVGQSADSQPSLRVDTNAASDVVMSPSRRCKSGGDLDEQGRCVSVTSVEADIVCPPGFAMNNGRCDKPVSSPPGLRCPANFVLQGDVCVQTVPAEPYCYGEKETLTTSGTCISLHSEPPIRSCPQRSVMSSDGQCAVQVVYENDLELYCDTPAASPRLSRAPALNPVGGIYALVNDVCVKVIKNRHVMVCPPSYTFMQNQCVLNQTAQAKPDCGNATYDPETKQCHTTTTVDQLVQCPKGYELDTTNRTCRSKKAYHAQLICPEGFTLKKKRAGSSYECQQHQQVEATSDCGDLGIFENDTCVHRIATEAVKKCAEGFELFNGVCQQTVETLVVKACPPDYKQVGNACVGKVPTETQTLTIEDRRLLIDALQGFSRKGPATGTNRKKADTLGGASANNIDGSGMPSAVMSTNDQDLLNMAEILSKWQKSNKKKAAI